MSRWIWSRTRATCTASASRADTVACRSSLILTPDEQVDLVKDEGHLYFIRFLSDPEEGTTAQTRAQAAFVLATICVGVVPRPPDPLGLVTRHSRSVLLS